MQHTSGQPSFKTMESHRKHVLEITPTLLNNYPHILNIKSDKHPFITNIIRPDNHVKQYKTVIYVPGTAFVANEHAFTNLICTILANYSNYQFIIVRHPLSPENKFPIALNSLKDTIYQLLKNHEQEYAIDPNHIVLMGYSTGGNFIASLTPFLVQHDIQIAAQFLLSPLLDLSRSQNPFSNDYEKHDKALTNKFVEWFINCYVNKTDDLKQSNLSPLFTSINREMTYPATHLFFGEDDRFRGDSEGYYLKLFKEHLPITKHMFAGCDHSYLWYNIDAIKKIASLLSKTDKTKA